MKVTNYRRGGIVMLPFVTAGILIAALANAPWAALVSIAVAGYAAAIVLIVIGKRPKAKL